MFDPYLLNRLDKLMDKRRELRQAKLAEMRRYMAIPLSERTDADRNAHRRYIDGLSADYDSVTREWDEALNRR